MRTEATGCSDAEEGRAPPRRPGRAKKVLDEGHHRAPPHPRPGPSAGSTCSAPGTPRSATTARRPSLDGVQGLVAAEAARMSLRKVCSPSAGRSSLWKAAEAATRRPAAATPTGTWTVTSAPPRRQPAPATRLRRAVPATRLPPPKRWWWAPRPCPNRSKAWASVRGCRHLRSRPQALRLVPCRPAADAAWMATGPAGAADRPLRSRRPPPRTVAGGLEPAVRRTREEQPAAFSCRARRTPGQGTSDLLAGREVLAAVSRPGARPARPR